MISMAAKGSFTISFENPFWIGLYERIDGDKYEVCKITFGAEPKDYEIYAFLLKNWHKLKKNINILCGRKRRKPDIRENSQKQQLQLIRRNLSMAKKVTNSFQMFMEETKSTGKAYMDMVMQLSQESA